MKVVFALGNPGEDFVGSRHNVGFIILNYLSEQLKLSWQEKSRFSSLIAETTIGDEKVILVRPTTYYNDTGLAARALIDFYKLDQGKDFLAIHDDFALPFGTVRVRTKGSDAGNNGVKSLNNHLGESYLRLRIGTWNQKRNEIDDVDFVLGRFTSEERDTLRNTITPRAIELIDDFIHSKLQITSYHLI